MQSIIDIGSSTVKHYQLTTELKLVDAKSFHFKDGFTPEKGISNDNKLQLFELIKKAKHGSDSTKVYATSIFRKFSPQAMESFKRDFMEATGLEFKVVSQDEENEYLELALVGKFRSNEPIMLLNIGGGSTEIVILKDGKPIERKNIDLGVGTVNSKFPQINQPISSVSIDGVMDFVHQSLAEINSKVKIAFYTGGELAYMKLAGYGLKDNKLFKDPDHPNVISFKDFSDRNFDVFSKIKLEDLESLMPENPKWMHGARGCSALAQAIFSKYGIETIIPSNSNMIDGIVRKTRN